MLFVSELLIIMVLVVLMLSFWSVFRKILGVGLGRLKVFEIVMILKVLCRLSC